MIIINNMKWKFFSVTYIKFKLPSPETSKKKNSVTAAVIIAFTLPEIKKTKNVSELEYISYMMTLDCKKKN